ncbi:MAG TPA: flippase-like domain-containing protein [Anaerolineae bacterium]|nr:flippase-like domain-containing protein [Anaerolineae bacterium]
MNLQDLRGKLLLSLALGIAVGLGLALYGDLTRLIQVLTEFQWRWVPAILALTLLNYGLRLVKWHFYMRQIGVTASSRTVSQIFIAGLSMAMTPGKVGELLKAYLIKRADGTPMTRSAPAVMAERLTDGLAMFILAAVGLVVYQVGVPLFLTVAAAMIAFVVIIQHRPLALWLLRVAARLPLLSRFASQLEALYESSFTLLTPRNLLVAIGLGIISWSGECLAFYLTLRGLGLPAGRELLLQATFTLATSTLLGAVSFLPGGLGATDGSITGLLQLLLNLPRQLAVAATLIIRFCTLWFGVSLGLITLFAFYRNLQVPTDLSVEQAI